MISKFKSFVGYLNLNDIMASNRKQYGCKFLNKDPHIYSQIKLN